MSDFHDHPPLKQEALRELIEGGSEPFKRTNRSYILWCPHCKRQKLYVEKTTGMSKCFRCGEKGWANWMLAPLYNRTSEDLNEFLYGIVTVGTAMSTIPVLPDFWGEELAEDALVQSPPTLPPEMGRSPNWCDLDEPGARAAVTYLANRGVPYLVALEYGIGFDPAEQRVLVPVIVEGKLRGWQGRYIHATEHVANGRISRIPKVMTIGQLGGNVLMFQDRLKGSKHAVLVEGPFDALKCHLVGGNVASMGKDVSPRQLDIIVRSGVETLYVGLDRDAAREVGRIVRDLSGTLKLKRLLPPDHRDDIGDSTMEEMYVQFINARELTRADEFQQHIPMPKLWV